MRYHWEMSSEVHISKQSSRGWAVKRQGAGRTTSVHETQSEAVAAGRRLALKSGGAEVVIHGADGRIRERDTVGAAKIDAVKQGVRKPDARTTSKRQTGRPSASSKPAEAAGKAPATSRAPRGEGPRTTLRVPKLLAEIADQLAQELGVSRNDALLRLANRGARLYEQEQRIGERREQRWAAAVPGIVDIDQAGFPTPEESRDAVLAAREEISHPAR